MCGSQTEENMETESAMRETCKIKHDITMEIASSPTQHKHRYNSGTQSFMRTRSDTIG